MQKRLIQGKILLLFNKRCYTMTFDEICGHPSLKEFNVDEIKDAIIGLIDSGYLNPADGKSIIQMNGFGQVIRVP